MSNVNTLAILLIFPSLVSLFYIWSAAHSLYVLRKSKSKLKKVGKSLSLWQKLLLLYPLEQETSQYSKLAFLRILYYFMLIVTLLCICLLVLAAIFPITKNVLSHCVVGKFVVLDIPIDVLAFFMTKHGKNGGVVWIWEK